jgi:GMP synthase-like glutamine amidotransferase
MRYNILVLQHTEWQKPGPVFDRVAREAGVVLRVVQLWRESAADFAEFDALILLGGECGPGWESRMPFLGEERRLVRAWIDLNRPCLGFNLGCHLLAEAAGATIGPGHLPSLGFIEGHLTHEGRNHPLFQGVGRSCRLFKWHSQVIQSPLPRNMVLLATSKDCMVEACALVGRPYIVGLQCDNYLAIPDDVHLWLKRAGDLLDGEGPHRAFAANLKDAARESAAEMTASFSLLLRNFVSLLK